MKLQSKDIDGVYSRVLMRAECKSSDCVSEHVSDEVGDLVWIQVRVRVNVVMRELGGNFDLKI